MSHPNRSFQPSFNFVVDGPGYAFDGQVPELNINTAQQWMSSGPRSVQHQVPSPSASIRTVMTAPDPRSINQSSFHQANPSPIDNNIDPILSNNLSLLAPPGHVSRSSYNPIARHLLEQPWSAGNLRSSSTSGGRIPFNQSHVQYGNYRGGPGSDIDSNVLPSDSGYHSLRPQSVLSNEPSRSSLELPSSFTFQVDHLNVDSTPSEAPEMARMHSDQLSQMSSRSGKSSKILQCPECGDISKCKSDLKKHKLKHEKPFKCNIPKCKRAGQGFTTINDLDRHKKSVHRIGLVTKSYQCASETCRNKEKIWPRLDNFKQHIERMHKEEDELDLIQRSTFRPRETALVVHSITVAPMDTNLAVAGMGKSFSGNTVMDIVPTMDLSMDQDTRRWSSLSQNPDNHAKDMYRISNQSSGSVLGSNVNHPQGHEGDQEQPYIYHRASGVLARRESQAVLAHAATHPVSEKLVSETQRQKSNPPLSNAPQTKAEQQKSALQKLTRAITEEIKSSSSSDPVDLENLVLRVLHKATDSAKWDGKSPQHSQDIQDAQIDHNAVTLTKKEALKASQAISNLIKHSPRSAYTVQRRSTQGLLPNAKVCQECGYAVARDCDLRKHMKRHEKPYGCTYPKCHKRFGAKSDWKRHENSQHFQLEAFRCAQPSPCSLEIDCGLHLFRQEQFKKHLEDEHKMPSPEQREEETKRSRIGKNCQGQFWCGFCKRIIKLEARRNAAWDERFDHIARHFEKEKRSIDGWVCVEENKAKKDLLKDMDRYVFDDEEEREDVDAAGDVDDDVLPPPPDVPGEVPMPGNAGPSTSPQTFQRDSPRKRPASTEPSGPQRHANKRRMTLITNRYCCECHNGPCNSLQAACIVCEHELCNRCGYADEWMNAPPELYQ